MGDKNINKNDGNTFIYTFNFSEAINENSVVTSDFVIDLTNSGVSVQSVSLNPDSTGADVTFTVAENTDATFSIDLSNNSYTDQKGNGNRETIADLPIDITIDNIVPTITSPVAGNYDVTANPFTLTIEFSEELNLTDSSTSILTLTDIILTNATSTSITIKK